MTDLVEYQTHANFVSQNGIQLSLGDKDEARLLDADLIYWCDTCECYHPKDDTGLEYEIGGEIDAVQEWLKG